MCEQPKPVNFLPNAHLLCWRLLRFLELREARVSSFVWCFFNSMWCTWGAVLLRISHLSSPAGLPWLLFSGWCTKSCNITDHLLLPFLQGCFCTGCLQLYWTKNWALGSRFLLALQIENDDQPGCLRDALRKSIKDRASCIVFFSDGGYPARWAVDFKISACCSCSLPSPCEEWYTLCVQNLKSSVSISGSPPSKQIHGLTASSGIFPINQSTSRADPSFPSTRVIRVDLQQASCLIPGLFAGRRAVIQVIALLLVYASKAFSPTFRDLSEVKEQMHSGLLYCTLRCKKVLAKKGGDKKGKKPVSCAEEFWAPCMKLTHEAIFHKVCLNRLPLVALFLHELLQPF